MEDTNSQESEPIPERVSLLRRLPAEIVESFTREELHIFLHDQEWPDSLGEKLKDYLVDEE